ncbi:MULTISPECIES: SH3 domain-containing protein [Citricoccus]|uniref:SH3 domain-containing protein n=1 Tax=Citricoccus TaxID=169133 RepID=UPI000255DFCC|nr:SH3 domain-containing protein [Citricoccus sp. CH26A]
MLHKIRSQFAAVTVVAALTLTVCGSASAAVQPDSSAVGEGSVVTATSDRTPLTPVIRTAPGQVSSMLSTKTTAVTVPAGTAFRTKVAVNLRLAASTKTAAIRKLAQGATVTATGKTSGAWIKVTAGSVIGWVHSGHLVKVAAKAGTATQSTAAGVAYTTKVAVNLRKGASTNHGVVRKLAKGAAVTTTGKKSGSWLHLKAGASTGWIHSGHLTRSAAPKPSTSTVALWTKTATGLYADQDLSEKLVNIPAQAKVTKVSSTGMLTRITYGTTTGWVSADLLSAGQPGTTAKPYPNATGYSQRAANNIAKWCWGVPVKTYPGTGGFASFYAYTYGPDAMTVTELIEIGSDHPVSSPQSLTTQYHECAHILQYRAYQYDGPAMDKAMDRIYPKGGSNTFWPGYSYHKGTEHMADCMSEVMGAKRINSSTKNGVTTTWYSGYGGSCTTTQLNHAKKLIAGQRV